MNRPELQNEAVNLEAIAELYKNGSYVKIKVVSTPNRYDYDSTRFSDSELMGDLRCDFMECLKDGAFEGYWCPECDEELWSISIWRKPVEGDLFRTTVTI
jgi:hypothetical protein